MSKDNPYKIPKREEDMFIKKNYAKTYGELTLNGIKKLLKGLNKKNLTFADLGSGSGQVVINVAKLYPSIGQVVGIELSKTRHNIALKKKQNIINNDKIVFLNKDILKLKNYDFDIIYISNLCFPEEVNNKLSKIFDKKLKKGTIIFTSRPLYLERLHKLKKLKAEQSWAKQSEVYKYEITN